MVMNMICLWCLAIAKSICFFSRPVMGKLSERSWAAEDTGILSKELQASFVKKLTQPSATSSSGVKSPIRPWKDDAPLTSIIRILCDVYLFFKAYIHQWSVMVLTGVVAILACALRGNFVSYKLLRSML